MKRFYFKLIVNALTGLLVLSCVKHNPEDSDSQKQMLAVAQNYFSQMKAENLQGTMEISDLPFFLDANEVIVEKDALQDIYKKIFNEKDLTQLILDRVELTSLDQLDSKGAKLRQKMKVKGFEETYLVIAYVSSPQFKEPEPIVFMLKWDNQSRWRVVGFMD